jgi:hypothetical protein
MLGAGREGQMSGSFSARPSGWEIASRAWRSVFQAMARMPVLFVSGFVLFLLLEVPALVMVNRVIMGGLPPWFFYVAVVVRSIISALVTAPVAVAVHRWVLLNDFRPGAISWKPPYTRLFFLWALALHLVYIVVTLPTIRMTAEMVRSGITGGRPNAGALLNIFLPLLMIVVSAYLALIFPDVAIGEPSASWVARAKASVARVRGNFWLLVRASILAFLPLIVIQIILTVTLNRGSSQAIFTMALFGPSFVVRTLTGGITDVLTVGLAAATVSWLYSWVRTEKPEVTSG